MALTNPYAPPQHLLQDSHVEKATPQYPFAALAMMALAVYAIPNCYYVFRGFLEYEGPAIVTLDWRFWVYALLASIFATLAETRKSPSWQLWLPLALFPCLLANLLSLHAIVTDLLSFVIDRWMLWGMLKPTVYAILFGVLIWWYLFAACKRTLTLSCGTHTEDRG